MRIRSKCGRTRIVSVGGWVGSTDCVGGENRAGYRGADTFPFVFIRSRSIFAAHFACEGHAYSTGVTPSAVLYSTQQQ